MAGKEKIGGIDLLRLAAGKIIQDISMEKLKETDLCSQTDKLYRLTQHLMRERSIFLPKYGIFAQLEERLEPVVDHAGRTLKPADTQKLFKESKLSNLLKKRKTSLKGRERHTSGCSTSVDEGLEDAFQDENARRNSLLVRARASAIVHAALWDKKHSNAEPVPTNGLKKLTNVVVKRKRNSTLPHVANGLDKIAILRKNVNTIENKFKALTHKAATKLDTNAKVQLNLPDIDDYRPSRFQVRGEASLMFRRYAKIIIIIHLWLRMLLNNDKCNWEKELKSFVDIAVGIEENQQPELMQKAGLSFDKSYFKTNKQISLSSEVRKTLTTRASARTPEMLKQVLLGLQSLQSLGEYPIQTQEKLCQVAWYQKVPSRKAIVRQGHPSECFYFVLGGTAFVKKIVEDPDTGEPISTTVAKLTKGQSFGEVGLIFNNNRTATVESASEMEMLVVGKADFYQIFMNTDDPEQESSHIIYLRQQPLLKYWPIDVLKKEPGSCLLHYFKRGTLVCENGKQSDWIYFIKSGTCEAIQSLKAAQPRPMKSMKSGFLFSEFGVGRSAPRIDSGIKRKSSRGDVDDEVFHEMNSYYTDLREKLHKTNKNVGLHLPEINQKPGVQIMITSPRTEEDEAEETTSIRLPAAQPRRETCSASLSRSALGSSKYNRLSDGHCVLPPPAALKKSVRPKSTPGADKPTSQLDSRIFVKVELLQAKDVFGVNTLKFVEHEYSNVPSVSLVSKGAEIVMLSKRLFLKYADDRVKKNVTDSIRYYPREATLQENLQIKVDWEKYRRSVIDDTLKMCKELKSVSGLV
ncbi:hypothetical protein SNE40_016208 [Patella caerulea]|uniref:Cyclic nucleotide-binding domain-containing protein n=1 Tax=Patella caerulea TaxID=87958 RepID=A0AAN8JAM6_PATCE